MPFRMLAIPNAQVLRGRHWGRRRGQGGQVHDWGGGDGVPGQDSRGHQDQELEGSTGPGVHVLHALLWHRENLPAYGKLQLTSTKKNLESISDLSAWTNIQLAFQLIITRQWGYLNSWFVRLVVLRKDEENRPLNVPRLTQFLDMVQ